MLQSSESQAASGPFKHTVPVIEHVEISRLPKPEVFLQLRTASLDQGRIYLLLYLYYHLPFLLLHILMAQLLLTSLLSYY